MSPLGPQAEFIRRRAAELHAEFMANHHDLSRSLGERITAEGEILEEFAAITRAWVELIRKARL
jgi:hypothetical protein